MTAESVRHFYEAVEVHHTWLRKGELAGETIFALGDITAEAFQALITLKDRVDDFFQLCRLAEYDQNMAERYKSNRASYAAAGDESGGSLEARLRDLPLASVEPRGRYRLIGGRIRLSLSHRFRDRVHRGGRTTGFL